MKIAEERSAWVTPLQWNGECWSYSWGSFQELEWARRDEADRAEAFAKRASLVQRLLKQNDRVVTLGDDASILVYRRVKSLDCVVVDSYPPIMLEHRDWAVAAVSRA
jgi:hypothetical protein